MKIVMKWWIYVWRSIKPMRLFHYSHHRFQKERQKIWFIRRRWKCFKALLLSDHFYDRKFSLLEDIFRFWLHKICTQTKIICVWIDDDWSKWKQKVSIFLCTYFYSIWFCLFVNYFQMDSFCCVSFKQFSKCMKYRNGFVWWKL